MNFPDFRFWFHLLATVGVEVCCLAALGFVAQLAFRRAVWQRTIWQMTVACLLLLPASEWTGFGRGMVGFLVSKNQAVQNAPASGLMTANPEIARRLPNRKLDWRPAALRPAVWWPARVWLAGTVIILGRMAAAQILLLTLRWRREKIADDSLRKRVLSIAKSVGLRRKICLLRLPESISPMVFGICWPTVGLPPGFESKFSATEQEAMLAHELAHLAAMDPMWFWVADFASALLWWHPLAWWVRRSLHVSSELAADEATALVPDGPGSLAKCLVALGKEMTAGRGWGWVGINGGFRSKLGKRVERLMRMPSGVSRPLAGRVGAAARIAVTIFIVPTVVVIFGAFQSVEGQREDGWRQSWNNSPGALLALAALDDTGKQKKEAIATRFQDAKLYFEMGKLNEAEAILVEILRDDPSNRTAPYYLDLIKVARFNERRRKASAGEFYIPNAMASTNVVYTTKGRQEILSKLDRIRLVEVRYDLPLAEVLKQLRVESKYWDPDGLGINFLINPHADAAVGVPAGAGVDDAVAVDFGWEDGGHAGVPPGAGADTASVPAVDMSTVTIKISPPLRNLRLSDVLNAITMVADQPIKYKVEDYGVVFSPKPAEAVTLYTKVFRVDPNTFVQGLKQLDLGGPANPPIGLGSVTKTNETLQLDKMVRAYFTAAGVNLAGPGKSVFFNDRLGLLLVRASASDLENIQQAVATLDQPPSPQVMITATLAEADEASLKGPTLDWLKSSKGLSEVITETQCHAALAEIERANIDIRTRQSIDILILPKVSTESGRAMSASSDRSNNANLTVIATVRPDGFSVETVAILSIKTGSNSQFNWHIDDDPDVLDGHTLFGMLTKYPPDAPKSWMVFITPRIIDSTGNPVHTDDEISSRH